MNTTQGGAAERMEGMEWVMTKEELAKLGDSQDMRETANQAQMTHLWLKQSKEPTVLSTVHI